MHTLVRESGDDVYGYTRRWRCDCGREYISRSPLDQCLLCRMGIKPGRHLPNPAVLPSGKDKEVIF